MSCQACAVARQLGLNWALLLDKAANAVLLAGDPNETLSRRLARAALVGERWAIRACAMLNWLFRAVGSPHNHCAWSLLPGSVGREIWSWSPPAAMTKTLTVPVRQGASS